MLTSDPGATGALALVAAFTMPPVAITAAAPEPAGFLACGVAQVAAAAAQGNEAADMGQAEIDNQSIVAQDAVNRLLRKNPRLRTRDDWDIERMHDELGW